MTFWTARGRGGADGRRKPLSAIYVFSVPDPNHADEDLFVHDVDDDPVVPVVVSPEVAQLGTLQRFPNGSRIF